MTIIAKDIGIVMDEARLNSFPLPLCTVAEQVFTSALGAGMAREDDGRIVKLWERFGGQAVLETGRENVEVANAKELEVQSTGKPSKVLFVGLGAMGTPMARAVQKSGIEVAGHDVNLETMDEFIKAGGKANSDVADSAQGAEVVVIMTNTALQVEAALFGGDATSGISAGGSFFRLASCGFPADRSSLTRGQHHHRLLDHFSRLCNTTARSSRKGRQRYTAD